MAPTLPPDSTLSFRFLLNQKEKKKNKNTSAGLWALISNVSQAGGGVEQEETRRLLTCWLVALQGSTSTCPVSRLEVTPSGSWAGGWKTALHTGWPPTPGTPTGGTMVRPPLECCLRRGGGGCRREPLPHSWHDGEVEFCSLVCFQASLKSSEERTTAASSRRSWLASPGRSSTGRGCNPLHQTTNNAESPMLLTDSGLGAEPPPPLL